MQAHGNFKKNPAGLEQEKKISSSLKILQPPIKNQMVHP